MEFDYQEIPFANRIERNFMKLNYLILNFKANQVNEWGINKRNSVLYNDNVGNVAISIKLIDQNIILPNYHHKGNHLPVLPVTEAFSLSKSPTYE